MDQELQKAVEACDGWELALEQLMKMGMPPQPPADITADERPLVGRMGRGL